ncbi:MAG: LysR family transcriptional regulator [Ignavibacteriae bacterium]|nr:LysR family transcriptional regulator [Ignavibacteriota bacterium]
MTLTQFSYIIAIDNHKSFAEAANNCFVTQPTLSMQVKKLEEELGVRIFDRSKQPVKATEIGKKIIEQARVVLCENERIHNLIDVEKGEFSGKFKVGIIPTIAPYLIPLFLKNFIKKYPKVELTFDELQTDQIINKLVKDELDTAIIATPTNRKELIEKNLYYEPFVAYVSESHKLFKQRKVNSKELNIKDIWLLKDGHCLRDHVIQVCSSLNVAKKESIVQLSFEGGTLDTLMKLVDNNFGMTLLPYLATLDINKTAKVKHLREFNKPIPGRTVSIIYHRAYVKEKLINAFEKEILSAISKNLLFKELR